MGPCIGWVDERGRGGSGRGWKMKIGKCKLCNQERELLNKSHVIPNSFFRAVMDENNSLIQTSNLELRSGIEKPKKIFTGEFDKGILCSECDNNVLGGLDKYGHKVFYAGFASKKSSPEIRNVHNPQGSVYTIIKNVDYRKFKLFLLSILWRASISSRPFFKEVSLGPYEEILRKMLFEQNPGKNNEFPILIYMPHDKELNLKSINGQPRKFEFQNQSAYLFTINGFFFIYVVSVEKLDPSILEFTVNTKNEFRIFHLPEGKSRDYILRFLNIK